MRSHRHFISSQFSFFVRNDNYLILAVNNSIINPLFSAPEPSLHYDYSLFDGWFGIPFQDSLHTIHIRAPYTVQSPFSHPIIPFLTFFQTYPVSLFIYPSLLPL